MIQDITRGTLVIQLGDYRATFHGEQFNPADAELGFDVWPSLTKTWDAPHAGAPMTEVERALLLAHVREEFARMGAVLDVG